jgi:hypothetical protein
VCWEQVLKDLCRLEKMLGDAEGIPTSAKRPADWPVAGSLLALMQISAGTKAGGREGHAARVADEELAGLREAAGAANAAEDAAGSDGTAPLSGAAAAAWRGVVATAAARIAERRRRNLRTQVLRSDNARGQT